MNKRLDKEYDIGSMSKSKRGKSDFRDWENCKRLPEFVISMRENELMHLINDISSFPRVSRKMSDYYPKENNITSIYKSQKRRISLSLSLSLGNAGSSSFIQLLLK